jgi:predicted molibdopterin-dependent oxidoreductase YjgC
LKESFPPDLELLAVLCSSRKEIPPEAKVVFPVLPARLKEGTFTNSAGLQQQNSGALSTGGIWPEWQVIAALIRALGAPAECSSLQEVQEEISRIAARR